MTETIQRAKRIGGSLMIRIPKDIVASENIQVGEAVHLEIKKLRKDWFGCAPGLKLLNKEEYRFTSKYE